MILGRGDSPDRTLAIEVNRRYLKLRYAENKH